jgi:hypothetical protein
MAAHTYAVHKNKLVALPRGTERCYMVASGVYGYRLPDGSHLTQKQLHELYKVQRSSHLKV